MTTPDERPGPSPEPTPPWFASPGGTRPIPPGPGPAPADPASSAPGAGEPAGPVPATPEPAAPASAPSQPAAPGHAAAASAPVAPSGASAPDDTAPLPPVEHAPWSLEAQQASASAHQEPVAAAPSVPGYDGTPFGAAQAPEQPQGWPPGAPVHAGQPAVVRIRKRRTLSVAWVVPLLVLAMLAGLVGGLVGANLSHDDHLTSADLPTHAAGSPATGPQRAPDSVAGIAQSVLPSVVSIEATSGDGGAATGTGFVLREDGYLLTNNHVVAGAAGAGGTLTVTFPDGRERDARIVGRTPDYDLAVIKVDEKGLTPLVLGDSGDVAVGDPVVAVGAPLGLAGTVTTGIVSALNRPVSAGDAADIAFINAIQTDAAINPGNSGGPLVDAAGEVIGINSAIAQPPGGVGGVGGSIGLGFAIPSNQARRTAEQLIESGRATYPIIGVSLDRSYVGEGVKVATEPQGGTSPVTPDGPADRAGIRPGDVVLTIDGRPVTDPNELIVAIRAHTPGDVVELSVRTGDSERTVRVTLDEAGD
ncbi:S1C family serine protease [Cellulomonas edaphi]|uniref:Trypsin-like peptidase domain-containing protein n=1 Tax=Cellulomonas edaphi TaxID=3053468 RepID=A0ABT7S5B3_9CELL|nr:trypsin-like peptidase domain-containing protein [Cellulomons edaphi]MDM7830819.1 trypsin-like peptidase domain-containing protein [Cellulomons edaphi]